MTEMNRKIGRNTTTHHDSVSADTCHEDSFASHLWYRMGGGAVEEQLNDDNKHRLK